MAMDDLLKALQMFQGGVQQLQMSRAIANANEQVMQIKQSEQDEAKQRQALYGVSNALVSQLAGMGAPATTIAQVTGAIGPKQFASADQAILEGTLSGNQGLVQRAQQADEAATTNQLKVMDKQMELQDRAADRRLQQALAVEAVKEGRRSQQMQKQGDVEFGTNVEVALKEADKLEKLINNVGSAEIWDTKASAQLQSAAYQLAINYAKIVDPASVAREGEVAAAQKYLIPLGWDTRNSVSKAAVQEYKAKIKNYVTARARQRQMGGTAPALPAATQEQPAAPAMGLSKYLE